MRKRFRVVLDGEVFEVEVEVAEPGDLEAVLRAFRTGVVRRVTVEAPSPRGLREGAILAPITGRVVEVRVRPGDRVEQDSVVAVLEAMKARIEVRAGRSGTVAEVLVSEGSVVKQGQPLIHLS